MLVMALFWSCGGPNYRTVEMTADGKRVGAADDSATGVRPAETPDEESAGPRPVPLDGFQKLEWKTLRGLDVKTGKSTNDLAAFTGANVKINGFMVPFDDDEEQVTEFLLVPQAGMCIHTPPPPPNQIILVEVGSGGANRVEWDKEVSVFGQFQIVDGNSPYGKTGFKISAIRARAEE
jgi:uncharacterized protein